MTDDGHDDHLWRVVNKLDDIRGRTKLRAGRIVDPTIFAIWEAIMSITTPVRTAVAIFVLAPALITIVVVPLIVLNIPNIVLNVLATIFPSVVSPLLRE